MMKKYEDLVVRFEHSIYLYIIGRFIPVVKRFVLFGAAIGLDRLKNRVKDYDGGLNMDYCYDSSVDIKNKI